MILSVMKECRRFFNISSENGKYEIKNGTIAVTGRYVAGQRVLITGSILNNGVKRVENFENGVISFVINTAEYLSWIQPTGIDDAYRIGDKTSHKGERWISTVNSNMQEPDSKQGPWSKVYDSPEEHVTVDEPPFKGIIYGLDIPRDFLALVDEITEYEKRPGAKSNIISETVLGIHSYKVGTDSTGAPLGWEKKFSQELSNFRNRMFYHINI